MQFNVTEIVKFKICATLTCTTGTWHQWCTSSGYLFCIKYCASETFRYQSLPQVSLTQ